MAIIHWQIANQSHCGNVRKVNEDALLVQPGYPLFTIADGMGGHAAGDIASQMLIDELTALQLKPTLPGATEQVNDALLTCNNKILDYSASTLDGKTAGSTVVAMLSRLNQATCLWAGDSRLYRHRDAQLEQLTEDHSYVAELVKSGQLAPEDAINHPNANIITRTVGAEPDLQLDKIHFEVKPGDTYLLCSDGLYNEIDAADLQQALAAEDIFRSADSLLNLCLRGKARDNVSFIIARALEQGEGEESTEPLDATIALFP